MGSRTTRRARRPRGQDQAPPHGSRGPRRGGGRRPGPHRPMRPRPVLRRARRAACRDVRRGWSGGRGPVPHRPPGHAAAVRSGATRCSSRAARSGQPRCGPPRCRCDRPARRRRAPADAADGPRSSVPTAPGRTAGSVLRCGRCHQGPAARRRPGRPCVRRARGRNRRRGRRAVRCGSPAHRGPQRRPRRVTTSRHRRSRRAASSRSRRSARHRQRQGRRRGRWPPC